MRVDFYQLSRDPVEQVVPFLAGKILESDERLLIVDARAQALDRLSRSLWGHRPDGFLAHDRAGGPHPDRQPILLADTVAPANGATHAVLADGVWRDELDGFKRIFTLFDAASIDGARGCWRMLAGRGGVDLHYWRQDGGRWVAGP